VTTPSRAAVRQRYTIDGLIVTAHSPVLQRRPLHPATDLSTLPMFGADKWSLAAALPDRRTADQSLNWARYPAPLRQACKLYTFALVNIVTDAPRLANARSDTPGIKTLVADLGYLYPFVVWLHDHGVTSFPEASKEELDRYYHHVSDMPGVSTSWKRKALVAVQRLHAYRERLPEFARLPAGPLWGGASAAELAQHPPVKRRENSTARIHPDVMEVLLSAALTVVDTVAADLVPVARRMITLRTLAHGLALEAGSRPPVQGADRNRFLHRHLDRMLAALAAAGGALPRRRVGEQVVLDDIGFAAAGWFEREYVRHNMTARQTIEASGLALEADLLRVARFTSINSRPWREDPVDADTLPDLVRHVTTACFLVIAYLSGVRTGEALNLTRGCVSRDDTLGMIFLSGQQMKASGDRRERSLRTVPWVVTEQTAQAVATLEAISPGRMLFPGGKLFTQDWMTRADEASRRAGVVSRDIGEFITWFNAEIAPVIDHPVIDDDPNGKIIAPRLRRTLAWHIVRRPGGTIAGATQYGHVHTQLIQGYAGRADAGFLDEITFEEFLLRAETLLDDHERLQGGDHVSGPSAEVYSQRLADSQRFAGLTVTTHTQANQALANPALQIYHGALLTCVYRPETAACRDQDDAGNGPAWPRCRLLCGNIARTDRDIARLRDHVHSLQADMAAPGLPDPLRRRIQQRLEAHRRAIADHHTTQTPPSTLSQPGHRT
jgi:integrase